MWSWLTALLAPIGNIATTALENKAAKVAQKHTVEMAIMQNKARLASDEHSYNSAKEMQMLTVARPWMRWLIVMHVVGLIDVIVISPRHGTLVLEQLDKMPQWLVGLYITIFGFYFAVNALTGMGTDMISKWKSSKPVGGDTGGTDGK
jgi:hypothetical protein